MNRRKRKLSKPIVAVIITAAISVVLIFSLLIVNIFVPVRYLSAYFVKGEGNEEGVLKVSYVEIGRAHV